MRLGSECWASSSRQVVFRKLTRHVYITVVTWHFIIPHLIQEYEVLRACLGYTKDESLLREIRSVIPSSLFGRLTANTSHQKIESYFEEEEERCLITESLNGLNSTAIDRLCPCIPPKLSGFIWCLEVLLLIYMNMEPTFCSRDR